MDNLNLKGSTFFYTPCRTDLKLAYLIFYTVVGSNMNWSPYAADLLVVRGWVGVGGGGWGWGGGGGERFLKKP